MAEDGGQAMRLDRERGEGACLYFGERPGSRFVGVGLGMSGYRGRWRFYNPTVHFGRLFSDDRGRTFTTEIVLPAALVHAWRWLRGRA